MRNIDKDLKERVIIYGGVTILLLAVMFMVILQFTGFFSKNSEKVSELLNLQKENTVEKLEGQIEDLEVKNVHLSKNLSKVINGYLQNENMKWSDLNNNVEAIEQLECQLISPLEKVIENFNVTGVFTVLDVTCNTDVSRDDRASVYLRRDSVNGERIDNKELFLFRGAASVAKEANLKFHNRWDLEFDTSRYKIYRKMIEHPITKLENSNVWSEPVAIKETWEKASIVAIPIIDANDRVIGICGFELSEIYFNHCYPNKITDEYGDINFVIGAKIGDQLDLKNSIISGSEDFKENAEGMLDIKPASNYNIYAGPTDNYMGVHQLLKVNNVTEKKLAVALLISKDNYTAVVLQNNLKDLMILGVFFIILAICLGLWIRKIVAPWSEFVSDIKSGRNVTNKHFQNDGINKLIKYFESSYEIGDSEEIELSTESIACREKEQHLPDEIETMLNEFIDKVKTLTPMERTVLQHYIDGDTVADIAEKEYISINTAKKHNTNLNKKLEVSNREELMVYIDVFRRCGRLEMIEVSRVNEDVSEEKLNK